MSTEIKPKPGDTLRVIDANSQGGGGDILTLGQIVTVESLGPLGLINLVGLRRGSLGAFSGWKASRFEHATPAPLDPSKVRVQKQVRWATDLKRSDVIVSVEAHNAVTVEREEPAPEPEPEWEPGTVAVATVRGAKDIRVIRATNAGGSDPHEMDPTWISADLVDRGQKVNGYDGTYLHHDDDVTDVRPLVVIDPAAVDVAALVEEYQRAYTETDGYGYDGHARRSIAMRAALAHLGIEATS